MDSREREEGMGAMGAASARRGRRAESTQGGGGAMGRWRAELLASCAPSMERLLAAMEEKLLLAAVWEKEVEGCSGCKRIGMGVKNDQGQGKGSIFINMC
jgi:hypothetical protein